MRGREGVVDVEVAVRRKGGDEIRLVPLLALVEAGVLQQQDVAILHRAHGLRRRLADAVLGEGDRAAERLRRRPGDRRERLGRVGRALRPAEMGEKDDLRALVRKLRDRGRDALDARRVRHLAIPDRHVEIDADKHAPARNLGLVERTESGHGVVLRRRGQMVLPTTMAVSAMRLEKPHSLSYHDMTRTRLPSMTLVWSSAKVDEAGLWLRSIETSGSLV